MKICLVGDFREPRDMGERNLAHNLAQVLGQRHPVMTIQPRAVTSPKVMWELRKWNPDVIHYLTGPQSRSFVVLWLLKWIGRCKISVMSAPRPVIPVAHLRWLRLIQPDLVLSQSSAHTRVFQKYGFRAQFFPSGVDTDRFQPVGQEAKKALREKYGVPLDRYVVLHVGFVARRRGINLLARLACEPELHVILVAATSWAEPDAELLDLLSATGCRVIMEYLPKIEEVYQMSDCFVFPGVGQRERGEDGFEGPNQSPSIEIPLSVLEALACNLPVVTRRMGGLRDMFPSHMGVYLADDDQQLVETVGQLRTSGKRPISHPLLRTYAWETVVGRLETLYDTLMPGKKRS